MGLSKWSKIIINLLFLIDLYNQINNITACCSNKTVLVWARLYTKLASWVQCESKSIKDYAAEVEIERVRSREKEVDKRKNALEEKEN